MKYIASRRYGGKQDNICLEWKNLVLLSQKNLGFPSGLLRRQNKSIGECKSTSAMVGCHILYIWYTQNVVINISDYGIRFGLTKNMSTILFKCILITRIEPAIHLFKLLITSKPRSWRQQYKIARVSGAAIKPLQSDLYQTFLERISNPFDNCNIEPSGGNNGIAIGILT